MKTNLKRIVIVLLAAFMMMGSFSSFAGKPPPPTPTPSPTPSGPTPTPPPVPDNHATADLVLLSDLGVQSGAYFDTWSADDIYESFTEVVAGVGPTGNRCDSVNHQWSFNVNAGVGYKFHLQAYATENGDGDSFTFSYSKNQSVWVNMIKVTKLADDDTYQTFVFPDFDFSGTIYVKVIDTNTDEGAQNLDTVYIDHMYVEPTSSEPTPQPPAPGVSEKAIVGYYTSWSIYARDYFPWMIPADYVTHINYAFANIDGVTGEVIIGDSFADIGKLFAGDSSENAYNGCFRRLDLLKAEKLHVKKIISIGGWSWSDFFSDVALTPTSRATFAASAVNFMVSYNFDGVDIDWEYPGGGGDVGNIERPEDGANFVLLLAELRSQMDAQELIDGKEYELTIADAASPKIYEDQEDMAGMAPYLDYVNLMTYDMKGAWGALTGHQSQFQTATSDPETDPQERRANVVDAVQGHILNGIPASKITVGVPFYARSFIGVPNINNGLYQTFTGVPKGTWDGGGEPITGIWDYEDIVLNHLPGQTVHTDPEMQVPWLYTGSDLFIAYDNVASVMNKAAYVLSEGLGGMMYWEFSGDIEDHPDSLAAAVYNGLNP